MLIAGGNVLGEAGFAAADIFVQCGRIADTGDGRGARLDAAGLLVLPGIIDVHGDAFERQMMPRPGVSFPIDVALRETDRQVVANGITTVFHGVTWSWEPGLRDGANARAMLEAIEALQPQLAADTRYHLRHETYNLDAEPVILDWIAARRISVLAFNDHFNLIARNRNKPQKLAGMIERSGVSAEAFGALLDKVEARGTQVKPSIGRLAAAAQAAGVPLMSHDDAQPADRHWFRALGCGIAEFPMREDVARDAIGQGEFTVFGAPNVVRGGSHTGCPSAAEMAGAGLCSILASDYYYPALPLAAFRLAADGVLPLAEAWTLISRNPARALGLDDRGVIGPAKRADVVLVDGHDPRRPEIVATIVAGRIVHLKDAARLSGR